MSRLGRYPWFAVAAAALVAFAAPPIGAQAQPEMSPPNVLVVYLGHPAAGKGMAAEKATVAIRNLFAEAKWPTHSLTVLGATGAARIVVHIGYNSFADWEKDAMAVDHSAKLAAPLERAENEWEAQMKDSQSLVLKYEPELSYRPNLPVKGIRYFTVELVHVRLAKMHDFAEAEKMSVAAHAKAKIDEHWAAYQVIAGAPEGEYVFFVPQATLADWDLEEQRHGKAYHEAFGGEENWKKFIGVIESSVKSVETELNVIDPEASYVSEDWVKADPEFWAPKHAAGPAARRGGRKPAKPAAKE
jgi:hypothetical protein